MSRFSNHIAVVTAPTVYPVSLSEVKYHLRRTNILEDEPLLAAIREATHEIEHQTQRVLIETEFDYSLSGFPSTIVLPKPPLISVTSVKYLDEDQNEQTVATSVYDVDTTSKPYGRIYLKPNQNWPTGSLWKSNPVTVRFKAGYAVKSAGGLTLAASGNEPEELEALSAHGLSDGDIAAKLGYATPYERLRVVSATKLKPFASWDDPVNSDVLDTYTANLIPPELRAIALKMILDADMLRGDVVIQQGIGPKQELKRVQSILRRFRVAWSV